MASTKQIQAAKRNIKKAQAALRKKFGKRTKSKSKSSTKTKTKSNGHRHMKKNFVTKGKVTKWVAGGGLGIVLALIGKFANKSGRQKEIEEVTRRGANIGASAVGGTGGVTIYQVADAFISRLMKRLNGTSGNIQSEVL